MFSNFTPIKYILKAIEIIILYLALLFAGTGNAHAQNGNIVTQNGNTVEKIDRYLQAKLASNKIPGLAVAVVHSDSVIFSKGYGVTGYGKTINADTSFPIASLSKAFTGVAVMQLVEAGKIVLDSPVVKYIPSFEIDDPRGASITVSQLLHQTSGLADIGFPDMTFKQQATSLDEVIVYLRKAKLVSEPGETFHYHNPNYEILAKLVEAVSGERFSSYLKNHIFNPLEMNHTWDVPTTRSLYKDGIAKGYTFFVGEPVVAEDPEWFVDGAAGVVSSSNDMANWLRVQLNKGRFKNTELLSAEGLALTHKGQVENESSYAMGWNLNKDSSLYHGGVLWTYSSEQMIYTKDGYGIVVLFNSGIKPLVDYYSFVDGIHEILEGQEPDVSSLPHWFYQVCGVLVFIIAFGFAVRRIFRVKEWYQKYNKRPVWLSWSYLILRLLPLILLLSISWITTMLSGRVLSWDGIFLMMSDFILGIGLIILANVLVVFSRLHYLFRNSKA